MVCVAGVCETTPLVIVFWVRSVPSAFKILMLVELGTKATGLIPQISNPRTSCSPPMKVRLKGGATLPPYPVSSELMAWNASTCFLFNGEGLKYLASTVGRRVFTLPPRMLPANGRERNRLRPPVGLMGWLTVL